MTLTKNKSYAFYENVQVYRNGKFYNVRDEVFYKDTPESVTIKDYSGMEVYKDAVYNYKRKRMFKKNIVWKVFNGKIPTDKIVEYRNSKLEGHEKYSLDNLYLRKKYTAKSRKKNKLSFKASRKRLFNKAMKLHKEGFNIEHVCKTLNVSSDLLRKSFTENDSDLNFVFKYAKFKDYTVSAFWRGIHLSVIAQRKGCSLETIVGVIKLEEGIENPQAFHRKYSATMSVLVKNEMGYKEIRNIIMKYHTRGVKNEK